MSRRTPCPDLVHLRLFFHKPASAPEADSVRAHLAQCEVCRAILAGFEAGDGNKNTLADESVSASRRGMSSAETMQAFRQSEIAAGHAGGDTTPHTLADGATTDGTRAVTARGRESSSDLAGQ